LGKKIVDELELTDSVDTLGRWMAHYIAELIERSEAALEEERESLKCECADTILRLWEHRNIVPLRSPLSTVAEKLELLTAEQPRCYLGRERQIDDWSRLIHDLQDLHQRELRICMQGWILGLDLKQDSEYLNDHPDALSEDEHRTIRYLVELQDSVSCNGANLDGESVPDFENRDDSGRKQRVLDALQRIDKERSAIIGRT
jgi:hypothetical protein